MLTFKRSAVLAMVVGSATAFAPPLFTRLNSAQRFNNGAVKNLIRSPATRTFALFGLGENEASQSMYPIVGDEAIMDQKTHGTTEKPVQKDLRWDCDVSTADRICCFNRHYAEFAGYWETTSFLKEAPRDEEITFYDSVTGKPLFIGPRGRTFEEFVKESKSHGWPSFRDEEVVWENVRCLRDGEAVSVDGTHLGHNLPDGKGNRYCINLVSVAGNPEA